MTDYHRISPHSMRHAMRGLPRATKLPSIRHCAKCAVIWVGIALQGISTPDEAEHTAQEIRALFAALEPDQMEQAAILHCCHAMADHTASYYRSADFPARQNHAREFTRYEAHAFHIIDDAFPEAP